ncbi:uncharacterized protein [Lolium perenne]|uniref:uncharacterized protein isoform X2 n=1 Tax=Lolium perenne TaxID=4522 RepID=UPI003A99DF06
MDFHALPRRDLQALAKRNGVRANMTNGAMADALAALPAVDGIEEYVQQPVEEPTPAAEPVVQPTAEEEEAPAEEKPEISLPPDEVVVLDDSDEEEKDLTPDEDEQKAPARGVGRRRVAWAEPLAATAKRNRPAARKAGTAEAVADAVPARATRGRKQRTVESVAANEAPKRTVETDADTAEAVPEAVPARATRARSQRTVEPVAEDEAPRTRRTSRRKAGTQQEEEEKATQGDASDVEPAMAAPVSTDEGCDGAEDMEAAVDVQNEEQRAPVEEQSQEEEGETEKEDAAAVAVPARATRARSQRKVLSAAEEVAPKTRRASRRTVDAQAEEQHAPVEEQSQEVEADTEKEAVAAVPLSARATRARRQRTVMPVAEEEAPKTRRTSRRAVAKNNNSTEQEDEEKAAQGDVSDVEAAVPAPASSHEEAEGSEEMAETMDAQNAPIEVQSEEGEGEAEKMDASAVEAVPARATRARRQRAVLSVAEEAMPARATRARSQKTVVPVAEEEAPKGRRTSRRAAAKKTSTEQEEEEKRTQGDVSDMEADVPAPVSSDEEQNEAVCGSEEMEAATDAQKEEQTTLVVEEPSQEGETGTMHEEEEQQDTVSDAETAVPAASSDEEADCAEEIEASMDAEDEEQAEEQSREDEGAVADGTLLVEEEPAAAEHSLVYSAVVEQTDTVSSEEIQHPSEDTEILAVQEVPEVTEEVNFSSDVSEENEHCTAEEEPPVAEDVDSSVQESPVDIKHASEENEELQMAEGVQHANEENEDCKVEEELPVAEDVDSSVQESPVDVEHASEEDEECKVEEELQVAEDVQHASEENEDCKVEEELPVAEDVQQCEATEEIKLASEDTELVPVQEMSQAMMESGEATEDVDCTSDVDEENEEFEEEPALAELADSSVQEPLVDVQQRETTKKIQLASEDTEMVPMLESGEAVKEVDFTIDVVRASEEVLQSAAKVSEKKQDMSAEEVTNNTDTAAEEETLVATDEMPQMFEAMDEDVAEVVTIDYLLQANNEGVAVKESGFTADLTDVSMEEEAEVAANEKPLSLARMGECVEEEVVTVDHLPQATVTDDEGAVKESGFSCGLTHVSTDDGVVAADVMLQSSATKEENAEEVVAIDNQSEAMVTDDSGFPSELLDMFIEEQGVVADNAMLHSSSTMEENVEEVVTVDNIWQATVTGDEGFWDHLAHMSVDKEDVVEADEMQVSSATIEKSVELLVTVDKQSQATVADEEWAATESAFTGECTPVVDTARDFSDHIASPWSANVFEYATKSLSMDSITVQGPVTVVSEPVAVQRENDVKEGNEPEAALGKTIHSPLTIRKLRRAVAEENEADDAPLCIFIGSSGGEENSAEPVLVEEENEVNQPEATLAKILHSPLTIRKLRRAVAEENEADDAPLCIFIGSSGGEENSAEPVLVEEENEVNQPEAALAKILHSPLTIRKLRRAVAEENEADDAPLCIFIGSSGGEENSAEPVLVEEENEVNEPEAALAKIAHSPLTIRKLRRAVAEENQANDVPLCMFTSSSGDEENSAELVLVEREKEVNKPEAALAKIAHSPLTIRKLRRAVAEENEADDVPPCIFTSSSGGDENSAEPMLAEREKEVNEHEALSSLSLRKLRTEFNQIVAVAQENEVKEGEKSSQALDKLSLRKLRTKLKETLNAHKNVEPKRVPLGRLDENAC